ncbi:WbqC-like protein [Candidatus Methanoperedens nitroreducens]|uniref:WbqC-like protein n=1 Tax=Candidatus Methanoperedens nitratireducens TaxID=1392998 RepID=A0A062VAB6_9EURY|nr:WbqC family protein [Candidatus Methanoperedens nitroreducens]KCZ72285.1 WbqC-like protein [Candidatus Methanoperedens nitroreducens]MDJ1420750.1 WbqC family protein [Candidatus Methanoperedens sp.]
MIRVSVHQPMYLPYPGIFNKIKNVDMFVFLDDAQYSNQYYYNRNRIKTHKGELMLTVPVKKSSGQKLNQIQIENRIPWQKKHMKALIANYNRAEHFKDYKDSLEEVYSIKWERLHDLNMRTMTYLLEQLEISTPFYLSSEILRNNELKGTERLMEICKKLNADVYLSGISGREYLDLRIFEDAGIEVEYQDYKQKEYKQLHGDFVSNLSTIDILFNLGEEAKYYI